MAQVTDVHDRVPDAESEVIARAVAVRVRLDALVDRVTSSGGMDAALLRELERMHWNISRTAQALGISRNTLYRKIHKHNIVLEQ